MTDLQTVRYRLRKAALTKKRGVLTEIASESGVSTRTIYNLTHREDTGANLVTLGKLLAYFKREDRKATKP